MEERDDELERSDAERAFEDLRAEVKVLRRAVEDLPKAWAANQPANYTETLGQGAGFGARCDQRHFATRPHLRVDTMSA
jgi:hypothetical protein